MIQIDNKNTNSNEIILTKEKLLYSMNIMDFFV